MKFLPVFLTVMVSLSGCASGTNKQTVRICDEQGCSDRPRNSSTFVPGSSVTPEEKQKIRQLTALAEKDPRAAFDLGLRYFRGDGITRNSYQALTWMRHAAERGDVDAQLAVGRFYLMGLEEMGSDPAEAESWLSMATAKGSQEAQTLLKQAQEAKRNEVEYQKWLNLYRPDWYGYWYSGYAYRSYWRGSAWYFY
ncbi:MAG: tetratricopeptide repeat protein [Methylophilaceae bacterium]|uniref:tetratricopeptide repeat protein n=1 Tax=Methylobacillus sp. MM3 TaxID=1848039 RepID=UPI000B0D0EFD|nr:tetratricopeptide repeat protein [Methylobacillus sp. MM3]